MNPDDIIDRKSLEAWLNARPKAIRQHDAVVIAQRTACRVFPLDVLSLKIRRVRQSDLTALPILRPLLISGVAAVYPSPEVKKAATASTAFSASHFTSTAFSAAHAASTGFSVAHAASIAFSASVATSAAPADPVWREIRGDARFLASGNEPLTSHLWSAPEPDWFQRVNADARVVWEADDPTLWSFWLRWWDGVLSGQQVDWTLQRDIALIPDEDWQKGPAHIAQLIAEIELAHVVEATPNSEDILRGTDGLFYSAARSTIRPSLFQDAKEKVADTVAEIRGLPVGNLTSYLVPHLNRLDAVLQRYPDRPQRVHDEFEETRSALGSLLASEGLPSDGLTGRLLNQLDQGEIDIRRSDKEVAATVKARASARLHRMKADRKAVFDGAMQHAAVESRQDLKQEILDDIAATNDPAVPEEQKDAPAYRLVSRGARMAKVAKDEVVKSADDLGKIVKGAEAASKIIEQAPGWWDALHSTLTSWFS